MQTFDQALYTLYLAGEISYEDSIKHADSPNDLRLMIKLGANADTRYLGIKPLAACRLKKVTKATLTAHAVLMRCDDLIP